MQRRAHIVHRDIRNLHILQRANGFVPRARLKTKPRQHVLSLLVPRASMLKSPGAKEKTVVNDQILRRPDQSNPIAGRVDDAAGNQCVLPIPTSDAVVAGIKFAVADADIATGVVLPSAKVNAIPPAGDFYA